MRTLSEVKEHFGVREWGRHAPLAVRLFGKVDEDAAGCWIYSGARTGSRREYGAVGVRFAPDLMRPRLTHRVAYELLVGPIPSGQQIDHLCRVTRCVNPAHLESVTPRVNTLRSTSFAAVNAIKTHCPQGHAYDEANTHVGNDGGRYCRTCKRDRMRERARAGLRPAVQEHQHGTLTGYGYGCRCDGCRAAWRAHSAKRRQERAA